MSIPEYPIESALLLLAAFVIGSLLGRGLRHLVAADADMPDDAPSADGPVGA